MAKKKSTREKFHPGYDGGATFGGRQPRIDTAEKQKAAQEPLPVSDKDREFHPGYDGTEQ